MKAVLVCVCICVKSFIEHLNKSVTHLSQEMFTVIGRC